VLVSAIWGSLFLECKFFNTMISATYTNRNTRGVQFIDSLLCLLNCVRVQCYIRALG
jgi:hypothetical protein